MRGCTSGATGVGGLQIEGVAQKGTEGGERRAGHGAQRAGMVATEAEKVRGASLVGAGHEANLESL